MTLICHLLRLGSLRPAGRPIGGTSPGPKTRGDRAGGLLGQRSVQLRIRQFYPIFPHRSRHGIVAGMTHLIPGIAVMKQDRQDY